jgi:hypothetical protein
LEISNSVDGKLNGDKYTKISLKEITGRVENKRVKTWLDGVEEISRSSGLYVSIGRVGYCDSRIHIDTR